jgi:hypothetical protein
MKETRSYAFLLRFSNNSMSVIVQVMSELEGVWAPARELVSGERAEDGEISSIKKYNKAESNKFECTKRV